MLSSWLTFKNIHPIFGYIPIASYRTFPSEIPSNPKSFGVLWLSCHKTQQHCRWHEFRAWMLPWALYLMGSSARWVPLGPAVLAGFLQAMAAVLQCTPSWLTGPVKQVKQNSGACCRRTHGRSSLTQAVKQGLSPHRSFHLLTQGHNRINVKDVSLVEPRGNVCNSSCSMPYPCQTYSSSIFGKTLNLCECFSAWVINRKYASGLISEVRKVRNLCNGNEIVFGKVVLPSHHSGLWYLYPVLGHKGKTRVLC